MTDLPTVHDYSKKDGWQENGLEQCPHCGVTYAMHGYVGPVWDSDGRRSEYHADTDPMDGPYFCEECWSELESNRRANENTQLADYQ